MRKLLLLFSFSLAAHAQQFRPGDVIEYKVRGKQHSIREKPNQFYPEGSQSAYLVEDVRRPGAAPAATTPKAGAPAAIRDLINLRGVNFVKDDDFRARMDAQGTHSTYIGFAVESNYGRRRN